MQALLGSPIIGQLKVDKSCPASTAAGSEGWAGWERSISQLKLGES